MSTGWSVDPARSLAHFPEKEFEDHKLGGNPWEEGTGRQWRTVYSGLVELCLSITLVWAEIFDKQCRK